MTQTKDSDRNFNSFIRFYEDSAPAVNGPLSGLSYAVKDCIRVKDAPLSFGLLPALESKSSANAAIVDYFTKLGARLIGSTNMDPAGVTYFGDNPNYGRIINPLDATRIVSGSSGGSAVAVACGFSDFAIGTDFGGSVRAPAAACSIFGLKLPSTTLPSSGSLLVDEYMDCFGIFAKELEVLERVISAMQISVPIDEKTTLLIPSHAEISELAPEYAEPFFTFINQIRAKFETIPLVQSIGFAEIDEIRKPLAAKAFERFVEVEHIDAQILPDAGRALYKLGKMTSLVAHEKATLMLSKIQSTLMRLLKKNVCLITPTLPRNPPTWEELKVNRLSSALKLERFLTIANLCNLSAISAPTRIQYQNHPFSVQLLSTSDGIGSLLSTLKTL